jgi:hypothetical protein
MSGFDISNLLETWAKKPKKPEPTAAEAKGEAETANEKAEESVPAPKPTAEEGNKGGQRKKPEGAAKSKPIAPPQTPSAAPSPKVPEAVGQEEASPPKTKAQGKVKYKILKCGHMNFSRSHEVEGDPKQAAAVQNGFCCAAEPESGEGQRVSGPSDTKRMGPDIHWKIRGLHEPVPPAMRRASRKDGPNWPGLCCDRDGFYIGGVGNDCRFYRPEGKEKCETHKSNHKASNPETEPGNEE